jgi:ABC-type transport system involved in multi-copper enzyme maturation permease subunit
MSTTSPSGYAPMDVSSTAGIPFWRLVLVELRKSVDTLASFWLLMAILILLVLVEGFVLVITLVYTEQVTFDDFTAIAAGVSSLLLPVLGIMLVTSEWSQRTAMVTFSIEPRRVRVVMAKLVVGLLLTVATVVAALAIGFLCTLICEIAQPDQTAWDLSLRFTLGFLITQWLAMAGGFALATLLLNTPAAIVCFFIYKWAIPIVLFTVSGLWEAFQDVSPYLNFLEAQDPLFDLRVNTGEEWAHLLVSGAIWLGLPLGLGIWRILRAEVK